MTAPVTLSYGPGNVDESLTMSWTNLIPGIKDNVFNGNTALNYFTQNGRNIKMRGGTDLSHGILFEKNSTAKWYSRYEQLDTTPQDGLTRDRWDWKQVAVSISMDGFTERVSNTGKAKLADAMETKKMQAEESLRLELEKAIFAASPASDEPRSLPVIVLASGSEGDINGTTNSWWQSQVTASGSFAAQGRSDMTTLYNTLSNRNPVGAPNVLISTQSELEFYESSLVAQERYLDNKLIDVGIMNLRFKQTPWIWSPQANSGVIYFIDKSFEYIINSDTDFHMTDFVKPANQDARVAQILVALAQTTPRRRKLGKLTGVTA